MQEWHLISFYNWGHIRNYIETCVRSKLTKDIFRSEQLVMGRKLLRFSFLKNLVLK